MKLIFISDYYEAGVFFVRLSNSLPLDKNDISIITTLRSVHGLAKENSLHVRLANYIDRAVAVTNAGVSIDANQVRELISGSMTQRSAERYRDYLCSAIRERVEELPDGETIYLCTWNGENVIGSVMRRFRKENESIKTLFFEITNLPRKLFYCEEGVNAKSRLFYDKSRLPEIGEKEKSDFDKWVDGYIKNKINNNQLPQAKNSKKISMRHVTDHLYAHAFCGQRYEASFVLGKLKNKLLKRRFSADVFETSIDDDYIFFPMQVSDDSQILINSDLGNEEVIQWLIERYAGKTKIVVKPHPAEGNHEYLVDIMKRYKDKAAFTQNNTMELIRNAKKVVVINSSVGLEAMLMGKRVTFKGRSFYEKFTNDDLASYVMSYAANIDFFDQDVNKKIPDDELKKIFPSLS